MSPTPAGRRLPAWLAAGLAVAIVAALLVRLPAVVEPLGIDQGIFSAAGWGLSEGLMLYTGVWDQKPPGIHLTYRAAFAVFGARPAAVFWVDFSAVVATIALAYALGRRAGGPTLAMMAAATFAVTSIPALRYAYGGFLERAVAETFIAVLAGAAALVALGGLGPPSSFPWSRSARAAEGPSEPRRLVLRAALIGMLVGAAGVYKPTALVYWAAFVGWGIVVAGWRPVLAVLGASVAGLLVVPAATVLWLWSRHALADAWIANVDYNLAYVAVGDGLPRALLAFAKEGMRRIKRDPLWLMGAVSGAWAVWNVVAEARARRLARTSLLWLVWLAAALVAAFANGVRLYNSYFIPVLLPLAMLTASMLATAIVWRVRSAVVACVLAAVLLVATGRLPGWTANVWRTTAQNYGAWRDSSGTSPAYLERFGGYGNGRGYSARANAELVAYLRATTLPGDSIFIFGMQPGVYFEAQRLPAHRFLWVAPAAAGLLHRDDFTLERLSVDLERAAPVLVILEQNNRVTLDGASSQEVFARPPMQRLLTRYTEVSRIEDFVVYRRPPGDGNGSDP